MLLNKIKYGIGTGGKFNENTFQYCLDNNIELIDCANFYKTQKKVGNIIKKNIDKKNFKRENHFIISKLWINELGRYRNFDWEREDNQIELNCKKALNDLNLDYLDAILIHWPLSVDKENYSQEFLIDVIWPQMENLIYKNYVKYIGVSNFGFIELQSLLNICKIKPYINQLEINPYQFNKPLIKFCLDNSINVIASSPFAFGWKNNQINLFNENIIKSLSDKYSVNPPNIILKWLIQNNVIPIPGSSNIEHIKEYSLVNNFTLSKNDINEINLLNKNLFLYNNIYNKHNISNYPHFSFRNSLALVGTPDSSSLNEISITDINFLKKCLESITIGPGYIVLKNIFTESVKYISDIIEKKYNGTTRHYGNNFRVKEDSLINQDIIFSKLIDNNIIGMIVDSLLGYSCIIDNIAVTISKKSPNNGIFGPHQDSPFEQRPFAKLPPCNYPMVIQCIYCIDNFNKENGGLFVVPFSHHKQERCYLPRGSNVPNDAIPIETNAGDVILATGIVWHGTYKNNTDKDRKAFLCEYISQLVNPRDLYNSNNLRHDFIKQFSRRLIRSFKHPGILNIWKDYNK